MTNKQQIQVHDRLLILKRDFGGDLLAAATYCDRVAEQSRLNIFSDPLDYYSYNECAMRLRAEHEQKLAERRAVLSLADRGYSDNY